MLKLSHVGRPHEASSHRRFFWFVECLYLLGLAVASVATASPAPGGEIELVSEHWMPIPAPEHSAFLMLADGRRIDAVFEWSEKGSGKFVLKEAAGTQRERPFALGAGDTLEATLHYTAAKERLYSDMIVELLLVSEHPTLGSKGVVQRTFAGPKVSLLSREAGEPVVSEPFRLTVPTEVDAGVLDRVHTWMFVVHFAPGKTYDLLAALTIHFSAVEADPVG